MAPRYTAEQGQYLAYIYYYTKIHKQPPAEADRQEYFGVTPPSVHQMVLGLEQAGLIGRTPRVPRSIRLLPDRKDLPDLD
jgi:Mn-dependent DtxR family transcriptional regulator